MAEILPLLTWKEEYSVNVKILDNQHKELIETINLLLNDVHSSNIKEKIPEILTRLHKYATKHFATEEKYFKKFNYDGAETHIKKHMEFKKELEKLEKKSIIDAESFSFKLVDFLEDWLLDHVIRYDKKYVKCFKEHGLK